MQAEKGMGEEGKKRNKTFVIDRSASFCFLVSFIIQLERIQENIVSVEDENQMEKKIVLR